MINPGDRVLISVPAYLGAISAFNAFEAEYLTFDPLNRETLRRALKHKNIQCMYVNPTLQNPNGETIPEQSRRDIMQELEDHEDETGEHIIVVEDLAYNMLNLDGEKFPPTFHELDNHDRRRVAAFGSTSKIIAPALRIGFVAAPKEIKVKMVGAKPDLCTSTLTQALATIFLEEGYLQQWLPDTIETYRRKRELFCDALCEFMPEEWKIGRKSPMFAWIEGPEGVNTEAALQEAITQNIAFLTGKPFYPDLHDPRGLRTARLNFTNLPEEQIVPVLEIVGKIFAKQQQKLRVASGDIYL